MTGLYTAKTFPRPFTSFALVPSAKSHPLTSNVMLVNKDGDLELYAVHDTPVHPPWSSRGDLALGIGCSYTVVSGITDPTPPKEPWEVLALRPSRSGSLERRRDGEDGSNPGSRDSFNMAPATFGRGDEDGFPALSPTAGEEFPGRRRQRHDLVELPFEHTALGKESSHRRSRLRSRTREREGGAQHVHAATPKTVTLALVEGEGYPKKSSAVMNALQNVVESDISMLMRRRAVMAYGLLDVSSGFSRSLQRRSSD